MLSLSVPLVLASRSPRRSELLHRLGLSFETLPSDVVETIDEMMAPAATVEALALRKARQVAQTRPEALVLGADTIVVLGDEVLGKPRTPHEASAMLRRLSGQTHEVYSGVALVLDAAGRTAVGHDRTEVTFGRLSDREIAAYVATGSPMDKAGGYGIQDDAGAWLIDSIAGDYYNVVGLPLRRLYRLLTDHFAEIVTLDAVPKTDL